MQSTKIGKNCKLRFAKIMESYQVHFYANSFVVINGFGRISKRIIF